MGVYVDMGGIIPLEISQGSIDKDIIPLHLLRQRLLDQIPHPMPDHFHVFIPGVVGELPLRQGIIHRLAEVIQRIQQCSV